MAESGAALAFLFTVHNNTLKTSELNYTKGRGAFKAYAYNAELSLTKKSKRHAYVSSNTT